MAADRPLRFTPARLVALALGGALALYTFMEGPIRAWFAGNPEWNTLRPDAFHWPQFLLAFSLMAWPALSATLPASHQREVASPTAHDMERSA